MGWNATGYNPKPTRLDRDVAKFHRKQAKASAKRAEEKAIRAAWQVKREGIYKRDHGCSRVSGRPLKLHSESPFDVFDVHHKVFRSAGGSDDNSNLMGCSREEHNMLQGRHHKFRIDVEGDCNATLTLTKVEIETGRIVQQWESPNPSA